MVLVMFQTPLGGNTVAAISSYMSTARVCDAAAFSETGGELRAQEEGVDAIVE